MYVITIGQIMDWELIISNPNSELIMHNINEPI